MGFPKKWFLVRKYYFVVGKKIKDIMTAKLPHLPILLAGPVLRRAEPEQVCIWIACSRPVTIKAEIFRCIYDESTTSNISKKDNNDKVNQTITIGLGSSKAIRLGERLY